MDSAKGFSVMQSFLLNSICEQFLICTSLQILREHIPSHYFPVEQRQGVSHHKVRESFSKRFSLQMGDKSFWKIFWGTALNGVQMHFPVI